MFVFIHMLLQAGVICSVRCSFDDRCKVHRMVRKWCNAHHIAGYASKTEQTSSSQPHYRLDIATHQGTCWTLVPTCCVTPGA